MRIEYFVAVIDCGSITAAAERLRVSQPAVSRQIALLERELEVELFQRVGRRSVPTAAGELFASEARRFVAHAQRMDEIGRDLRAGRPPALSIAAPQSTIDEVIAPYIAGLSREQHLITAHPISSLDSPPDVLDGADLAITAGAPARGLRTLEIGRAAVCAQVPAEHPWAKEGLTRLDLQELDGRDVILQSASNQSRVLLNAALAERGIRPHVAATGELESIVQSLAAAGHGIGVLTESPRYELHAIRLFDRDKPLEVVLRAAWQSSHYAARSLAALAEELRERMGVTIESIARSQHWL